MHIVQGIFRDPLRLWSEVGTCTFLHLLISLDIQKELHFNMNFTETVKNAFGQVLWKLMKAMTSTIMYEL